MDTKNWALEEYRRSAAWGLTCSVDLKGCDPALIRNAGAIKDFVVKLCELIEMKRYGETQVVNFGEDPRVSGFSMIQLIETSLISGHFANQTNAAYIDIFSCKYYPPETVAAFCKDFFKAKSYMLNVNFRI
ncbi:MAG TPA: S-adenosylmethionine decarboxylase [Methanomicrobia archaeon]|nr:S-adenosylmethionine decarboxylase [Methanomicrobia archaeon]